MIEYLAYKNSWNSNDPIILGIPDFDAFQPYPGSSKYDVGKATGKLQYFNNIYTYFVFSDATYRNMNRQNFPRTILVHVGDRIYISENKYFLLGNGGITGWIDGVSVGTIFSWDMSDKKRAYIFPSINAMEYDGGYSYYLHDIEKDYFYIAIRGSGPEADPLNQLLDGIEPYPTDPYTKGGESSTGGGTGDFDGKSEAIDFPNLPTLSAVDTGLITLFNPSPGEIKNLANYLWGDIFDVSTWKKIFANPMDAILGLSIVPVNVPSSGSSSITIGNISTGINMTKASSQYVSVDCGTINVNEYWGAYLDYSPYTEAEIYLPFVGIHPLKIDDIMGKPVHVVYHVDVLSGACCSYVKCGNSVLYSFVGQCSCSIPITANDWTNVINGAISMGTAIGSMVATGGASAPMAVPGMASTAVNSLKPSVEKSGAMGGMGGMLGVQKPYIILTRPKQALPHKQNTFTGYPSFITKRLGDCYGYTEVESIHLENVHATDGELKEINDLLKSGVIF